MTNFEIVKRINALTQFINKDKRVPIALSFGITKTYKSLCNANEVYEIERKKLIERKGAGNSDDEKLDEEFRELLGISTEIEVHTVPFSIIEKCDENTSYDVLTTNELIELEFMIEEEAVKESEEM